MQPLRVCEECHLRWAANPTPPGVQVDAALTVSSSPLPFTGYSYDYCNNYTGGTWVYPPYGSSYYDSNAVTRDCNWENDAALVYNISARAVLSAPEDTMQLTAHAAMIRSQEGYNNTVYPSDNSAPVGGYPYLYTSSPGLNNLDEAHAHVMWETSREPVPVLRLDVAVDGLQRGFVADGGVSGSMALVADQGRLTMAAEVSSQVDAADASMHLTAGAKGDPCYLTMAMCGSVETAPVMKVSVNVEMSGTDAEVCSRPAHVSEGIEKRWQRETGRVF